MRHQRNRKLITAGIAAGLLCVLSFTSYSESVYNGQVGGVYNGQVGGLYYDQARNVYYDQAGNVYYTQDAYGPGSATGPGSQTTQIYQDTLKGLIDDSPSANFGPQVESIYLTESYYDEFSCYSESLDGAAFIYSNVQNDGLTDQSVYVDIPANVRYRMEKDGVEIPYQSKAYLTEHGSYRVQLEVVSNPDDPVSEQIVYRAVFNFRIAPRTKAKEPETQGYAPQEYTPIVPATEAVQEVMETEAETESSVEIFFEEEEEPEIEITIPEEPEEPEKKPELSFDPLDGFYTREFEDGTFFSANVRSGFPVNYAVETNCSGLPGGAESVRVLRDEEEYEMPEDGIFREAGDYELQIPTENGSYHYRFQIFSHPVKGPVSLYFPLGTEVKSVTGDDGEVGFVTDDSGRTHVELTLEGTYILRFTDENLQDYETEITVDLTPPEAWTEKFRKTVRIGYENSEEISHVVIRQGSEEYEQDILYQIDEPGTYSLDIYDLAGNCTNLTFTLKKGVNIASVISILLIIGILAGGAVFFWKVRNKAAIK